MCPTPSHRRSLAIAAAALSLAACRRATAQVLTASPSEVTSAVCAEGRLGDVRIATPTPPEVRPDQRDSPALAAEAARWRRPPSVRFTVAVSPTRRGSRVELVGTLTNTSSTPQRVFLVEAGAGFFHATITGSNAVRRTFEPVRPPPGITPPPSLLPEPSGFTLAPGARWTHAVEVELDCWYIRPRSTVNVHWWFSFANESLQGDLPVRARW